MNTEQHIWSRLKTRIFKALDQADVGVQVNLAEVVDMKKLRRSISPLFTEGESWDNPSSFHIVHHIPCKFFNLKDPMEQLMCFCVRNLRAVSPRESVKLESRPELPEDHEEHSRALREYCKKAAATLPYTGHYYHPADVGALSTPPGGV